MLQNQKLKKICLHNLKLRTSENRYIVLNAPEKELRCNPKKYIYEEFIVTFLVTYIHTTTSPITFWIIYIVVQIMYL